MSFQGFLFLPDRLCPHCDIPLKDDFRIYNLRMIAFAHHSLGVCVACTGVDYPSEKGPLCRAASPGAMRATWGVTHTGLGHASSGFHRMPAQDTWPTMEDFASTLSGQLELSSDDSFFRTLVLLEHAAAIFLEEVIPKLANRLGTGASSGEPAA